MLLNNLEGANIPEIKPPIVELFSKCENKWIVVSENYFPPGKETIFKCPLCGWEHVYNAGGKKFDRCPKCDLELSY